MGNLVDGPDTSSFTAFTYSLFSCSESGNSLKDEQNDNQEEIGNTIMKENGGRKSLLSRGRQSLRALYQATSIYGYRTQDRKGISNMKSDDVSNAKLEGLEMRHLQNVKKQASGELPGTSEPSLLLTEKTRNAFMLHFQLLFKGESGNCSTVHGSMVYHCQHCTEEVCSSLALVCWLNGSSSFSETYGNPCPASSETLK